MTPASSYLRARRETIQKMSETMTLSAIDVTTGK